MPKCKNDPTRRYKGTEPSPTGLGFCSFGESLDTKMEGKDGNMWIVVQNKNRVKKWEMFQTYPYISIIIWFKNNLEIFNLNLIKEIQNIIEQLDDKDIGYEMGVSKSEIDFEIFDNFENLDKEFYQKLKKLERLRCEDFFIELKNVEILLIQLKNNTEEVIELG